MVELVGGGSVLKFTYIFSPLRKLNTKLGNFISLDIKHSCGIFRSSVILPHGHSVGYQRLWLFDTVQHSGSSICLLISGFVFFIQLVISNSVFDTSLVISGSVFSISLVISYT